MVSIQFKHTAARVLKPAFKPSEKPANIATIFFNAPSISIISTSGKTRKRKFDVSINCRMVSLCLSSREPTVAPQKTFSATSFAIFARKEEEEEFH
jgi:hypothetical protein